MNNREKHEAHVAEAVAAKQKEQDVGAQQVTEGNGVTPEEPRPFSVKLHPHEHPEKTRPRVAIIGFTESRIHAPYKDDRYEIWGENALYVHAKDCPRFDRWFDMHDPGIIPAERYAAYLRLNMPVYLQAARDEIPMSIAFPKAEVEAEVGDYMTNSISWMIGMAIWMGFEVIEVYGVDMAQASEYANQRPNVEYLLGQAKGRGIEIRIAETSDILAATHQYGYGTDNGLRKRVIERLGSFNARIAECDGELQRLTLVRATLDGSRQATEWMLQRTVADHTSMTPDAAAEGAPVAGGG